MSSALMRALAVQNQMSMLNMMPYEIPESPEGILARTHPRLVAKILLTEITGRHYVEGLAIGSGVVNTYLQVASQPRVDSINQVRVVPSCREGWGAKGMTITFRR